jgi:SAM-dependent methyltransferase
MSKTVSALYAEDYLNYLLQRGFLQKKIRKIYLQDIQKYCLGKTIDFGCGVGELLQLLPEGSIGYEINPLAVDYCKSRGLQVFLYDPENDNYKLQGLPMDQYESFTMNHVLEHTENTIEVIKNLFTTCHRIGIKRIVFTVPGIKGFHSDKTHRTFIDMHFFKTNGLLDNEFYRLKKKKYFPFNYKGISTFFVHNELRLIFEKIND